MRSERGTTFSSVNGILKFLSSLTNRWSPQASQNLCCLNIANTEFIFCEARDAGEKIEIKILNSDTYKDENELYAKLKTFIKTHDLTHTPCSLLLQSDDYQLLITEPLPVTDAEFQAAIRWKVKDLLRYSPQDVVIDHFNLPVMKNGNKKITVVAAQESKLAAEREKLSKAGVNLKFIDIPEMTMRNVVVAYRGINASTVLVYVQELTLQLLFIVGVDIYVFRSVKIKLDVTDIDQLTLGVDRLAAEILRSFDYYQNLWDISAPDAVLFASVKTVDDEMLNYLSQMINLPVERLDLQKIVQFKDEIDLLTQGKYLPIIGAVMREKIAHATD